MRGLQRGLVLLLLIGGCGDDDDTTPDAGVHAASDAHVDAGPPPSSVSPHTDASAQSGFDAGSMSPKLDAEQDAGSISGHVADAAVPGQQDRWCCLEQEIKWAYSGSGWVPPSWHLTREGTLEPMPYAPTVPGEKLTNDVSDCSQGRACLRDLHDALQHPDVVALFPKGMEFANGIASDGAAVFIDIGETRISFGLPYFPDLPDGLKPLYEVLQQLELQNLKDVVPSCAGARVSPPSNSSGLDGRIWVMSAYLGAALEFDSCEAAAQCECAARPLVDADFNASNCSAKRLTIAERCM